ncbi:hypothetical protein SAMN04488543_3348 [Friedmanniella luteola]|uniref:DUF4232 domain-containing protein n=1 Tax=Friedmanniella luteola TaxID=546871 RepID=A0A1H1YLF2_9ACTN|nr:hypothetical protein [Friedmanniella luteola]SDT22262.1 hypothetical protein SAMN04488543_3348 [Friedmanniella luteola]
MSPRITGLVTAALLTAAPLALGALPASAAGCTNPEVIATSVAPRSIVLAPGGTATFAVQVSVRANGCVLTGTEALLTLPTRAKVDQPLTLLSDADGISVFTGSVPVSASALDDAAAGTWKVRTSTSWTAGDAPVATEVTTAPARGDDEGEDEGEDDGEDELENEAVEGEGKVAVLRASSVSAEATSSALSKKNKIKKGKALTVKGALRRTSWETGAEAGYAKERVELQFRTPGGRYKKVTSLPTRAGGTFAKPVKATRDGCYRVVFGGSRTTAPATSAGDCIDVR